MKPTCFLMIPLALLFLAADEKKDAAKDEQGKLQGTWNVTAVEFDGQDVSGEVKDMQFVIKDNAVTVKGDYPEQDKYSKFTFTLDPAANPKGFDIVIKAGGEKGAKFPGIYQLEKDKLKLCLRLIGKQRPKNFATEAGSTLALLTLERAKLK
jgi:uncharacterized protein (TIGR03067 family)